MIRHVILWKLKEEYTGAGKEEIKKNIKQHLEALKGSVQEIRDIHVQIESLDSSNADLMLDSTFDSEEALKGYSTHPDHVKVADTYVRPFAEVRMCLDYEV